MNSQRRKTRKVLPIVLVFSLAATLSAVAGITSSGAAKAKASVPAIVIGAIPTLTGANSEEGHDQLVGENLAVSQINHSGGIKSLHGAKIRLVYADSGSTSQAQTIAATQQVISEGAVAVAGSLSSSLEQAAATVDEQDKIPTVFQALSVALVTRGYQYSFQLSATSTQLALDAIPVFIQFMKEHYPKVTKIADIYDSNIAESSTGIAFAQALAKDQSKIKVVLNTEYPLNFTDAGPLAQEIKSSGAQMIVPGATAGELSLIIQALNNIGDTGLPVFNAGGGEATSDEWFTDLGNYVDGEYVISDWAYDTNEGKAKNATLKKVDLEYKSQTHHPFMGAFAAGGYTSIMVLADAIENAASTNSQSIRDALVDHTFAEPNIIWTPGKIHFDNAGGNTSAVALTTEWCHGLERAVGPSQYAAVKPMTSAACGAPTS